MECLGLKPRLRVWLNEKGFSVREEGVERKEEVMVVEAEAIFYVKLLQ